MLTSPRSSRSIGVDSCKMQESMENPSIPFKRGKVKDVYDLGHDQLLFIFTDRVSAYDVVLPSTIPRKGEVLCKLAAFWFDYLKVPHHMLRVEDTNRMVVRRLKMIPVEAVVRGYLYGSLYERLEKEENIVLADSIGPDEFRLWPKSEYAPGKTQESYDKQVIRDWLGKVGYKNTLDEARKEGRPTPRPPDLPSELVQETSRRYIIAYEKLTGLKL